MSLLVFHGEFEVKVRLFHATASRVCCLMCTRPSCPRASLLTSPSTCILSCGVYIQPCLDSLFGLRTNDVGCATTRWNGTPTPGRTRCFGCVYACHALIPTRYYSHDELYDLRHLFHELVSSNGNCGKSVDCSAVLEQTRSLHMLICTPGDLVSPHRSRSHTPTSGPSVSLLLLRRFLMVRPPGGEWWRVGLGSIGDPRPHGSEVLRKSGEVLARSRDVANHYLVNASL